MNRHHFTLIAAFLFGALAGALAVGSWGPASDPGDTPAAKQASPPMRNTPAPMPDGSVPEPAAAAIKAVPTQETRRAAAISEEPQAGAETQAKLRELIAGWSLVQEEIARLQGRVTGLERRLDEGTAAAEPQPPGAPATPGDRRSTLIQAGVAENLAADIVWREAQFELDRLETRDLAMREGWFGTERYREEISRLESDRPNLRAEVGDEAYDRYLYASGEENRVRVVSIIPGSAAEAAGLMPGDVIESYDEGRVFSFSELRSATSEGERGELVPVEVTREDGSRSEAWLPRGPLGVRLDLTRLDPNA
jgi:membrane-associated protease RseP (regulator of RpoE activity)